MMSISAKSFIDVLIKYLSNRIQNLEMPYISSKVMIIFIHLYTYVSILMFSWSEKKGNICHQELKTKSIQ